MRAPPRPGPLYAIADAQALAPTPVPQAVEELAAAGVRWIQIRGKRLSGEEFYRVLEAAVRAVAGQEAALWVDDRGDLAALLPVAGLHLGQRDLPPKAARRVVGEAVWIGLSTHNLRELEEAAEDPEVDVIAVGPIFPTGSKERADPVVGLDFLREARRRTPKALVAIGGIDAGNIREVLDAGADAAAVLSAVCRGDVTENCRRLLAAVEGVA